jgi:hypothetical protein
MAHERRLMTSLRWNQYTKLSIASLYAFQGMALKLVARQNGGVILNIQSLTSTRTTRASCRTRSWKRVVAFDLAGET